jgi:hypothetical protein
MLAVALLAAVLVVGPRTVLGSRWLIAGLVIAAVIAAPNLWWQARHGWPQLTVAGGISEDDGTDNRIQFVPLQLLYLSPLLIPVWVAGFRRLWREPELRWARSIAIAYPLLCVIVLVSGGKPYYCLPLLLVVVAAGCESLSRWMRNRWRSAIVIACGIVAMGMSALITLPLLPTGSLSVVGAIDQEQVEQIGWPTLTADVARQWATIPAAQRPHTVIFVENYAEDGAIARFGPRYGLPEPYSGHMSLYDWGPPPDTDNGPVLLVYQQGDEDTPRPFTGCREVSRVDTGRGVDNQEQDARIALCSGTSKPWSALWPSLRHYY